MLAKVLRVGARLVEVVGDHGFGAASLCPGAQRNLAGRDHAPREKNLGAARCHGQRWRDRAGLDGRLIESLRALQRGVPELFARIGEPASQIGHRNSRFHTMRMVALRDDSHRSREHRSHEHALFLGHSDSAVGSASRRITARSWRGRTESPWPVRDKLPRAVGSHEVWAHPAVR